MAHGDTVQLSPGPDGPARACASRAAPAAAAAAEQRQHWATDWSLVRWVRRIVLLIAAGALAWRLAAFARQEDWGSWPLALYGAGLALGLYVGFGLALVTLVALFLRQRPPVEATVTAVLIVGLLAAQPVDFAYDDGCNEHTTTSPAGFVPVLALSRPEESASLSYDQLVTLVACPT